MRAAARTRLRVVAILVVVAAAVAAVVIGVRVWWGSGLTEAFDPGCTAGSYRVDTSQAAVASSMVAVVLRRELPERAATLVLTAAVQESKLRNIPAGQGDRDSVGVLQQRPSQGWGTPEQLADPAYATGAFLDKLVQVPNWQTAAAADVIQAVQISVDGTLYAEHEPEGAALADAFTGARPAGLTCTFAAPTQVATAATVAAELAAALPVATPVVAGRTVTVPGAGWPTATWCVANADRLGIATVDVAGRRWARSKGWSAGGDASGGSTAVVATLATPSSS